MIGGTGAPRPNGAPRTAVGGMRQRTAQQEGMMSARGNSGANSRGNQMQMLSSNNPLLPKIRPNGRLSGSLNRANTANNIHGGKR